MAASVSEFIKKGCLIHMTSSSRSFKEKLEIIKSQYSSLEKFKQASVNEISPLPNGKKLTQKEIKAIEELQKEINNDCTIEENFIQLFTKKFIAKQLEKIKEITINDLNTNPLLCYALKFDNPKDFIKFYTYQAVSRSIVTSMGFLVQDLLLYSNEHIYDGKNYNEGKKTKFDLVIDKDGEKTFFEIKSGFNDLDKGQIKHYDEELSSVEKKGNKAYIGITYGKKNAATVTSKLLETYVKDWKKKTFVGRELWEHISGKGQYHSTLSKNIRNAADAVLHDSGIVKEIEKK